MPPKPAKLTRANYDSIRDHLFERIHKDGIHLKNEFPNTLRTAINAEAWKQFRDFEGKPFENLVEWLHCTFPNGTSMGQGMHAITYEEALKLTEGAEDVHRVLAENAPKGKPGPKTKLTVSTQLIDRNHRSRTAAVLSVRLAQEKPKYYQAYLTGKYKSVTAAATDAGLLKNDVNLRRAKSAFRKMNPQERDEFLQWIRDWREA